MFVLIPENGSGADLYAGDAAEQGVSSLPSGSFNLRSKGEVGLSPE